MVTGGHTLETAHNPRVAGSNPAPPPKDQVRGHLSPGLAASVQPLATSRNPEVGDGAAEWPPIGSASLTVMTRRREPVIGRNLRATDPKVAHVTDSRPPPRRGAARLATTAGRVYLRTVFEAYVEDVGQRAEPVTSCDERVTRSGVRAGAGQDETADDVDPGCVPAFGHSDLHEA